MKVEKLLSVTLVLVASSSLALARQDEKAKPVPASAPIVLSKVKLELAVPVQGLTKDNAAKVEESLEAMEVVLYECSGCQAMFPKAGSCPTCTTALQVESHPILDSVTVSPDDGKVTLHTHEGMQLRLSDIERALGAASVKIDGGKLNITGNATLVVAGVANADQAKAIQKALEDSKLFQKVSATPQGGVGMVEVTAGATGSTRARVEECLAKVAAAHKLQDVVWNSWSISKAGP